MTVGATSPALAANKTAKTNDIYTGKLRTPIDTGAYTDYIAPDFPSADNVLTTDTVDGVTGTYNGAEANDVRLNVPIGQTVGNMVIPTQITVLSPNQYGANGTEFTGSVVVDFPAEDDVRKNVTFGGTQVGTAEIPSPNDVRESVPVDNSIGNLVLPTEEEVLAVVGFGSNGTEFTGTYIPIIPTTPRITSIVSGDSQFTANITTVDQTDTIILLYKITGDNTWTKSQVTLIGSGSIVITGLVHLNTYDVVCYAVSPDNIYSEVSNLVRAFLSSDSGAVCQYDAVSNPNETMAIKCQTAEYIKIFGYECDLYIMTKFSPSNVWGEDPLKKYEISPILIDCIWEPAPEAAIYGSHHRITNEEYVIFYAHIDTVKTSIKNRLIEEGFIEDTDTYSKEERHRMEPQEGDIIRTKYNNIHYEIVAVDEHTETQFMQRKYFYALIGVPRVMSSESLGHMQDITDADEIRETNKLEIEAESSNILF
jgi:hypothetical protein